jgi:hypothetical protein
MAMVKAEDKAIAMPAATIPAAPLAIAINAAKAAAETKAAMKAGTKVAAVTVSAAPDATNAVMPKARAMAKPKAVTTTGATKAAKGPFSHDNPVRRALATPTIAATPKKIPKPNGKYAYAN